MSAAPRDVVITGIGAVSALGEDCAALWSAVASGRTGISTIRRFPTNGFDVHVAAIVERRAHSQPLGRDLTGDLCRDYGTIALRQALASSGVDLRGDGASRVGLAFGTGIADLQPVLHEIAEELADRCGLGGPRLTVSTACSSSTAAMGFGRDMLAMGAADMMFVGGADVVTPEVFAGFHALGVLSATACAPFSTPAGTTLGEGAGFLVLERIAHARDRGARVIAWLAGCGLSGDGWHETSPDPKGAGVARAIRAALRDAALDASDIGYINAHGSGTESNDLSEWLGIQRAVGARSQQVPVSSSKGALGHAQGAAGILETIVTLLAMEHDQVPPTLHFGARRTHTPADPVPGPAPRTATWERALKLSAAFGGSNVAVVIARNEEPRPARPRSPIVLLGGGGVGPGGVGRDAWAECTRAVDWAPRAAPSFDIASLVHDVDERGLDRSARLLTAAAAAALCDAGVAVHGPIRDRTGLLAAQLRGSPASIVAFQRSIEERGLRNLSPTAFARIVLNAAAGACSKTLALRGPHSAITTGATSGLAAIVLAAELLSVDAETDLMVAGGVDEHAPHVIDERATCDEGAACVVLTRRTTASAATDRPLAHVVAWALAGPGSVASAIDQVCSGQSTSARTVRFCVEDATAGAGASGAAALIRAAQALGTGAADFALVTGASGRSLSAAVLLSREPVAA